jgi:hypothetical protein
MMKQVPMSCTRFSTFNEYDLLLHNQADMSMVQPHFIHEIMQVDVSITENGIGGKQLVAAQSGYLDEFFRVNASEQVKPNVLSLADAKDN